MFNVGKNKKDSKNCPSNTEKYVVPQKGASYP